MGNGPFEDVFPIKHGDIPFLCWFTRGYPFTTWCFQTYVILTLTWGDDPI